MSIKNALYSLVAELTGHNLKSTPPELIVSQLNEPRPLPMGVSDFHEWSDRIIAGAVIPGGEDDPEAFIEGQKYALADMIMHLGPTESHKPDAFFIHQLRKVCVNQVANAMKLDFFQKGKERTARKEAAKDAIAS